LVYMLVALAVADVCRDAAVGGRHYKACGWAARAAWAHDHTSTFVIGE